MTLEALIRAGDLAAATDLIRSVSDANGRDPEGLTLLMIAAGLGQAPIVELLLTAGADVLALEPRMGATALHKAAQSGSVEIIGLLLDHGAFIDQQSPILGNTPLMDAVLYKNSDAGRLLLDRGARTSIRNHWQQTALELARDDSLEEVALMIEARNQSDAEHVHSLILHSAAKTGNIAEVRRLLATEAPLNDRTPIVGSLDDDYTPLGFAAREGRADIVSLLLDAGADPRQVIGLMKGTIVHEAAFFGHVGVLRALTQKHEHLGGPAPALNAQGPYNGLTALHDAVWHGHLDAARTLVDAGAPLDLRTHTGRTPRELAVLYGYDDIARFLAEAEQKA